MTRDGTWVSYQGDARAALAAGLVLIALVVVLADRGSSNRFAILAHDAAARSPH